MLILILNGEIRKNKNKDKYIINTQRVFDNIPCKKFKGFGFSKLEEDEKIEYLERVVIKEGSKISIIPVETIKWIEAQDDYVMINCDQGRFLKQKTMKYFENHLNENNFIRIHRSYIINVDFIQHLEQTGKESYQIILKNEKQLPVSKTGLSKLRNTL